MDNKITVTAKLEQKEIDRTLDKVVRLNQLLKEAKSLADDLASRIIRLEVHVEI